jgi:serine/arginine repetitive matrix protein 2
MYNGIGLSTPRGSGRVVNMYQPTQQGFNISSLGTNGYVIRNLSHVKPPPIDRNQNNTNDFTNPGPAMRKANQAILDHDRKRKVEVKCMELRLKLEDDK